MTPEEIGVMLTEAFGEEKAHEIVDVITGEAVDNTMKEMRRAEAKRVVALLAPEPARRKKRWWQW